MLGNHPDDMPKPKKSKKTGQWNNVPQDILDEFMRLMGERTSGNRTTVWEVFEAFLEWTKKNKAERTYDFYKYRLKAFKNAVSNMPVEDLTPEHVYEWINEKDWSDTFKHGIETALIRAFNWAVKARKIRFNPLKGIEKHTPKHRDVFLSQEEFDHLLTKVKDPNYKELLQVVWYSGMRPQEARKIEKRHVFDGYLQFPKDESKGKKRERRVFLSEKAREIIEKAAKKYPSGTIFRNSNGEAWTPWAIGNQMSRIQVRMAKEVMEEKNIRLPAEDVKRELERVKKRYEKKLKAGGEKRFASDLRREARNSAMQKFAKKVAPRVCMYSLRHSFAHSALTKKGLTFEETATLMGHSSTKMLLAVYAHAEKNVDHMRSLAEKAAK